MNRFFFSLFILMTAPLYAEKTTVEEVVKHDIRLQTDFYGALVEEKDVMQGCAGKDCIRSIDNPLFVTAQYARGLSDKEPVLGVTYNGESHAYPIAIMNWHEVVNDTINGMPIALTYSPLCGTGMAFFRRVNGTFTTFGVSGKLYNNNAILYDRLEGNLWQQFDGVSIVGPAARRSELLRQLPTTHTTWGEWRKSHPDTWVLTEETGLDMDYSVAPYPDYEKNYAIYFPVKHQNRAVHPKTVVYGVTINGVSKAFPESLVQKVGIFKDKVGNRRITLELTKEGGVKAYTETKKNLPLTRTYWFVWQAFHPKSLLQLKTEN